MPQYRPTPESKSQNFVLLLGLVGREAVIRAVSFVCGMLWVQ